VGERANGLVLAWECGQFLPMGAISITKSWRIAYGLAFAAAALAIAGIALYNPAQLSTEVRRGVGFLGTVRNVYIAWGIMAAFSLIERIGPAAGARKPLQGYLLNMKITMLEAFAGSVLVSSYNAAIIVVSNRMNLGFIDLRFGSDHSIFYFLISFMLYVFIYDFFFYWMHRFQHESIWWHQHKLHHMDEQLCAFSRQSWFEAFPNLLLIAMPMAVIFKLNPTQGALGGAMLVAWTAFIHSNLRVHLGRFGMILNGPQGHRVHHSRDKQHYDRNFAAYFPIWDVIFRTYHYPRPDEYPATGVSTETEVKTLFEAATLPFFGWARLYRQRQSNRDNLVVELRQFD
jgi:sterol desaturase/sphingolipid hydroxylase (fatty acid hydroxylase superfamily)